jgi:hypothetical protein
MKIGEVYVRGNAKYHVTGYFLEPESDVFRNMIVTDSLKVQGYVSTSGISCVSGVAVTKYVPPAKYKVAFKANDDWDISEDSYESLKDFKLLVDRDIPCYLLKD